MIWQYVILALAVLVPAAAFWKKALSLPAALLAALMIIVALWASANHAMFLIASFLLITVLDKICKGKLRTTEENITLKTGTRDIVQVFVNGGISMICVLLWRVSGNNVFLLCFVCALVESFGDSAASDIGIATGQQAYDICHFRKITNGLSGGVTTAGTVGCFIACTVMSILAYMLKVASNAKELFLIFIVSFAGCVVDSVLGSLIQRKNRCTVCGSITEKKTHCNVKTEYYSGLRAVNNDVVNLACNLFSAVIIFALMQFSGTQFIHLLLSVIIAITIYLISTTFHEVAHWLMCKILGCRVIGMKIPFLSYDGTRWSFCLNGKNHCAFASNSRSKMKMIVAAGPLTELIVILGCLLVSFTIPHLWVRTGLLGGIFLIAISVIYDLLPITDGDGKMLFEKGKD